MVKTKVVEREGARKGEIESGEFKRKECGRKGGRYGDRETRRGLQTTKLCTSNGNLGCRTCLLNPPHTVPEEDQHSLAARECFESP
jgi:hypothetical protein